MNKAVIRPAINPVNILLVEDDVAMGRAMKEMLMLQGYEVTVCYNSVMAHNLYLSQPELFDLLITDQVMPDMNGDELVNELLQLNPKLPIIMCTGYSDQLSEESALRIGAKAFLSKPFMMDQLLDKVEALI